MVTQKDMHTYIRENIIKDVIIVILAIILIPVIGANAQFANEENAEAVVALLGLMLVFGAAVNFSFSYEKVVLNSTPQRYLAHVTTFLAQLLMVILLEAIVFVSLRVFPGMKFITITAAILSISVIILYDFWDLLRFFTGGKQLKQF